MATTCNNIKALPPFVSSFLSTLQGCSYLPHTEDPLTCLLGQYNVQHILHFLDPELRSFVLLTCSSWNYIIRKLPDFKTVSIESQGNAAARRGHLGCLKYLQTQGYRIWTATCNYASLGGSSEALECLKYVHANGAKIDSSTSEYAAIGGNLDCLRYIHENGGEWGDYTTSRVARGGDLECLRYSHENGCPWEMFTCANAAVGGHLECLKYAHENGCQWNEHTCEWAVTGGHLACLKYAHENGCKWDAKTTEEAARYGRLDCLKYAVENGCEWNVDKCSEAIYNGHVSCFRRLDLMWKRDIEHGTCKGLRFSHVPTPPIDHFSCLQYVENKKC